MTSTNHSSRRFSVVALAAALAVGVAASDANAQMPPFAHQGLYYRSFLAARVNPLGAAETFWFGYKHRLWNSLSDSFLQGSYVGLSLTGNITPASGRLGVLAEFQPLSLLNLSVQYDWIGHFGTFDTLTGYTSPKPPAFTLANGVVDRSGFSDASRKEMYNRGLWQRSMGFVITLGAQIQIRLGQIVARTNLRGIYQEINLCPAIDGVTPVFCKDNNTFYDITNDALVANKGWLFVSDTDLIYQIPTNSIGGVFNIGVRYSQLDAIYPNESFPGNMPSLNAQSPTPVRRAGPLFSYQIYERKRGLFNAPTIFAMFNWYITHSSRTGQDGGVNQAIPMFVLGFSFRGEIFPTR